MFIQCFEEIKYYPRAKACFQKEWAALRQHGHRVRAKPWNWAHLASRKFWDILMHSGTKNKAEVVKHGRLQRHWSVVTLAQRHQVRASERWWNLQGRTLYAWTQGIDYYFVKVICKIKIRTELEAWVKQKWMHFTPVKTLTDKSGNWWNKSILLPVIR